jgi:hypothetical protein
VYSISNVHLYLVEDFTYEYIRYIGICIYFLVISLSVFGAKIMLASWNEELLPTLLVLVCFETA